ncbi:MAG: xylulose kinase [Candidatus Lokiarchaeota archaeon]|nr:xylulose kinase [Candidatus Lokiarchaeota archaeon]MBD3200139.1 xylulose kinase [Candidatus Lokiarchaeota archaeon]
MSINKKKYILAIDHGTNGPKSALVSTHGEVINWSFEEVPLYTEKGGLAEQEPQEWWEAIKKTATKVIDDCSIPVEEIVGVCNSSQWSGTVPIDKDGKPLMRCIIWMDTRAASYAKKFHKGLLQVGGYNLFKMLKWLKITGGGPSLSGKDPISNLLWLKGEKPDIYNNTFKFLEPQDYINYQLTGKIAASFASIQLHWVTDIRDINNITYSDKLIKKLKLDKEKLPQDLKWSTEVLGPLKKEVADELGLEKDTKVVMGAPDVHSADIGSGAIHNYDGHIYIGTSDWVGCHVPYKKTDIFHNMASVPSAIPGRFLIANEQEIAGGALTFLRDKILYHKDELLQEEAVPDVYKIFDNIVAETPPGSNGLIFTPWLIGERAPIDDHSIRGGLYNLSLEMNREHIIRAIFEGVAFNVKWLHMYVEKFIEKWVKKEDPNRIVNGKIMPELNIIGGGAQSDIWCQIFADVLDRKIRQVKNPIQANARGAAFIAAVGLGYTEWDHIPKHIEFSNIFTPNPENRSLYDKMFKEYVNIYDAVGKIYERINE